MSEEREQYGSDKSAGRDDGSGLPPCIHQSVCEFATFGYESDCPCQHYRSARHAETDEAEVERLTRELADMATNRDGMRKLWEFSKLINIGWQDRHAADTLLIEGLKTSVFDAEGERDAARMERDEERDTRMCDDFMNSVAEEGLIERLESRHAADLLLIEGLVGAIKDAGMRFAALSIYGCANDAVAKRELARLSERCVALAAIGKETP